MEQAKIFEPMLATMLLTAAVWLFMYARRIPAMYKVGRHAQVYKTPDDVAEHLPPEVNYSAYNLKNLFELPVIFYGLCLYLYVTTNVDNVYLIAAWLFVAFRTLHSIVHCTRNIVIVRFYLYAAGALSLWFMLGRASLGALAG